MLERKMMSSTIDVLLLLLTISSLISAHDLLKRSNLQSPQAWQTALSRARKLSDQMTLEEINNITVGYSSSTNGCSGNNGGVPRLGYPGFCLNDAENGVRATDLVTGFANGISVGASWNMDLAHTRAIYLGAEFKRKGVQVSFGPVVEPMGRIALGGRNWEGFGADPYLEGKLAATTIQGMQQSIIATIKHFVGYEQETNRMPNGVMQSVSSNIDDENMHELYLWPFQDAVQAGVACVMCSYNQINDTYACENDETMNGLLKSELNFPGFVVSDFGGQHSGAQSARNGLDMAMPTSTYWHNNKLVRDVKLGLLSEKRLRDMATRILAAWFVTNEDTGFPPNGIGMETDYTAPHPQIDARDPASKPSTLQSAIEGHVLIKNTDNALPLNKPKFLSLFGYDASIPPVNNPTNIPFSKWVYGLQSVKLSLQELIALLSGGSAAKEPESARLGTLLNGGGSGASTPSYFSDPYSSILQQAYEDNTFLLWDFSHTNPYVDPASNACLVFINEDASEGLDRAGLADPKSDLLVKNVARKCNNTIVVMHNAGIRLVDAWIDNSNVTAAMYAHLPGQDSGRAMAKLLYGIVSPSGRMPYTVAKKEEDYGKLLKPTKPLTSGVIVPQSNFQKPSQIDYRYFEQHSIEPRFPFGYGLTYTTFSYSNLAAQWTSSNLPNKPPNPSQKIPGGIASLFNTIATVTVEVTNTGTVTAAEVPQLYVKLPGKGQVYQLRGFDKKSLDPGQSVEVTFELRRKDLSRWDVEMQQWVLQKGKYELFVGKNVGSKDLVGSLER